MDTKVLVDSGALVNCIDAEVLSMLGGEIKRLAPGKLYLADQRQAEVLGTTEVPIHGRGHQETATFWVIRGLGVEALLGESWLRSWNPRIDWKTGDLTFSDGVRWKAVRMEGRGKEEGSRGKSKIGSQHQTVETDPRGDIRGGDPIRGNAEPDGRV